MIFGSTFEKGASVSYPISETDLLSLMCSRWLGIYKTKKEPPRREAPLYNKLLYSLLFAKRCSNIHSNSNSSTYHRVVTDA